jgi:hypothetical protein
MTLHRPFSVLTCILLILFGIQSLATGQTLPPPPPLDADILSDDGLGLDWVAPNAPTEAEVTPNEESAVTSRPLYRVEVLGDSPLLLAQVRKVQPDAFVQNRAIQAGVFSTETNAQQQVQNLENHGIFSRIVTVDLEREGLQAQQSARAYYVVIPSRKKNLPALETQIRQLDIESVEIYQRDAPRGTHLAIGPFQERSQASYWNSYLRSSGFNARIYFGR